MPIPEAGRGAILDANRLLAFRFEAPVNTLILYDKSGEEVTRIDHWWTMTIPRGRGRNFDEDRLTILEDGETLDEALAATETVKYEVETVPSQLSDPLAVKVADRPMPGRNREWSLTLSQPKFKSKHFGPPVR